MRFAVMSWSVSFPIVLPYSEGRVPAGFPSPAEDHIEHPLDLAEYLIENKAATFLMRVEGDSMRDAGILDGDLLVVDRAAKAVSGSVAVVALNSEFTVKRLRQIGEYLWLEPANPRYKAVRVATGEDLHVFGVVRHAIHTMR